MMRNRAQFAWIVYASPRRIHTEPPSNPPVRSPTTCPSTRPTHPTDPLATPACRSVAPAGPISPASLARPDRSGRQPRPTVPGVCTDTQAASASSVLTFSTSVPGMYPEPLGLRCFRPDRGGFTAGWLPPPASTAAGALGPASPDSPCTCGARRPHARTPSPTTARRAASALAKASDEVHVIVEIVGHFRGRP